MLDEQSGERKASGSYGTQPVIRGGQFNTKGQRRGQTTPSAYTDTGGASRFFATFSGERFLYTSKASAADRRPYNDHPTCKSTELMRWLVTLVTPPGGTVLDCFAGSGSTLIAADRLGFGAIGIDSDPHAIEIARRRLTEDAGMFADIEAVV